MSNKLTEVKCECGQEDKVSKSWTCIKCSTWNQLGAKKEEKTKSKKKGWLS